MDPVEEEAGNVGGGYEWRGANGRPGITGVAIDDPDGKVLRVVVAYDYGAFSDHAGG